VRIHGETEAVSRSFGINFGATKRGSIRIEISTGDGIVRMGWGTAADVRTDPDEAAAEVVAVR
jgi:hypothetical protein